MANRFTVRADLTGEYKLEIEIVDLSYSPEQIVKLLEDAEIVLFPGKIDLDVNGKVVARVVSEKCETQFRQLWN